MRLAIIDRTDEREKIYTLEDAAAFTVVATSLGDVELHAYDEAAAFPDR